MSQFKFNPGVSKKSGMLIFKHPVKEMFFVAISDDVRKYETIKQLTPNTESFILSFLMSFSDGCLSIK